MRNAPFKLKVRTHRQRRTLLHSGSLIFWKPGVHAKHWLLLKPSAMYDLENGDACPAVCPGNQLIRIHRATGPPPVPAPRGACSVRKPCGVPNEAEAAGALADRALPERSALHVSARVGRQPSHRPGIRAALHHAIRQSRAPEIIGPPERLRDLRKPGGTYRLSGPELHTTKPGPGKSETKLSNDAGREPATRSSGCVFP